jgi:hypothetical protein
MDDKICKPVVARKAKVNPLDAKQGRLWHDIQTVIREFLMDDGVIPPDNSLDESIMFSVNQLNDMVEAYTTVHAVLSDIIHFNDENRNEIRTLAIAKFAIVTKGRGVRINHRYHRYLVTDGQGELDM